PENGHFWEGGRLARLKGKKPWLGCSTAVFRLIGADGKTGKSEPARTLEIRIRKNATEGRISSPRAFYFQVA
ncbi:MAG TPA: hypothetical protein PLA90_12375, partial [Candidatus Sumerlaeota bacterium]|nr:hypothetical protein [Candidatus Sumerlaeota bacterium]